MKTKEQIAFDFLRRHEGLRLSAYKCTGGVSTIGYGHTGADVLPGMTITREQAEQLLREDISHAAQAVDTLITASLTPCQWASLVSFTFNVGAGALRDSTLRRVVNHDPNDREAISRELRRWTRSGGRVTPGLVTRREDEIKLYFDL